MSEHTEDKRPDDNQDWTETWNRHVSEIDDKLVDLFKEAGERAGEMSEEASAKIQHWLDQTEMDEKARAAWDKAKADGKLLGAKVEHRIQHLISDGRIAWSKLTKKQDG